MTTEDLADLLGFLAADERRAVLFALAEGPATVSELMDRTGLEASVVDDELRELRGRKLVRPEFLTSPTVYHASNSVRAFTSADRVQLTIRLPDGNAVTFDLSRDVSPD